MNIDKNLMLYRHLFHGHCHQILFALDNHLIDCVANVDLIPIPVHRLMERNHSVDSESLVESVAVIDSRNFDLKQD